MEQPELIPHLFRTEFGKIAAVLCRFLGAARIDVAEEIAGETFVAALETWPYRGLPANPTAWLYVVAKNKARNFLRREALHASAVADFDAEPAVDFDEPDLSESNIADSQLRMLFALSTPSIPAEAQIGLGLRILCGFGIDEIASAFLVSKDAVEKRLQRARKRLRDERTKFEFPAAADLDARLESVLTTLYLLFNEGYYSECGDAVLRRDLCDEAMRLTELLLAEPRTARPEVDALLALMCFHASRFPARTDESGAFVPYERQDESLWDRALIYRGGYHLHRAGRGDARVTRFHLEAGIAFWHTFKEDTDEKWRAILGLFDRLLVLADSPAAALNRVFAFARVNGRPAGIVEARRLGQDGNRFYHALLGWLYEELDPDESTRQYERAAALATTPAERDALLRRIAE